MGSSRYQIGVRGIRSGHWSGSKWTNLTEFDPSRSELRAIRQRYWDRLGDSTELSVIVQPVHADFVMPVDEAEVRETLGSVPRNYLDGLAGVVLLAGSRKQAKTFRTLFAYGRYLSDVIFLHPFPRRFLEWRWRSLPKPSTLREYERAGVIVTRESRGWRLRFDDASLKRFYLRDVLLHELGHHVDAKNFGAKTNRKIENFADWFASEHGYRLRRARSS